jgi:hypothetical protein
LAPGLWFLAFLFGRLDVLEYLTLLFLVWLVAAITGIVVGIRARRREKDSRARRFSAAGLSLSAGLSIMWVVSYVALLAAAFSAG